MPLLYEKSIKVYVTQEYWDTLSDAAMDKINERFDDLLDDEPLDDAVSQFRKEYPEPTYRVEVD